jgi:hypothetical protein
MGQTIEPNCEQMHSMLEDKFCQEFLQKYFKSVSSYAHNQSCHRQLFNLLGNFDDNVDFKLHPFSR